MMSGKVVEPGLSLSALAAIHDTDKGPLPLPPKPLQRPPSYHTIMMENKRSTKGNFNCLFRLGYCTFPFSAQDVIQGTTKKWTDAKLADLESVSTLNSFILMMMIIIMVLGFLIVYSRLMKIENMQEQLENSLELRPQWALRPH